MKPLRERIMEALGSTVLTMNRLEALEALIKEEVKSGQSGGDSPTPPSELPAPGYWTAEPPEEPGYYWIVDADNLVEARRMKRGKAPSLKNTWWCGSDGWAAATRNWDWLRWSERIVEPPSPDACAPVAGEPEAVRR